MLIRITVMKQFLLQQSAKDWFRQYSN